MHTQTEVHAIVWSHDGTRIAAVAGSAVVLWEDGNPPSTFSFAGGGGAELRGDNRVVLLGDRTAARELVTCKRGNFMFAGIAGCEANIVDRL
jgi:hypothetical protein